MSNRFNPVPRGPSTFQLLRLPIVFGSLLISFGVMFMYRYASHNQQYFCKTFLENFLLQIILIYFREKILTGIVEEREKMYKEHPESQLLLQKSKEQMRRIHGTAD